MAVRWPDGSYTGSLLVVPPQVAAPVEPEPEIQVPFEKSDDKKEVKDAAR